MNLMDGLLRHLLNHIHVPQGWTPSILLGHHDLSSSYTTNCTYLAPPLIGYLSKNIVIFFDVMNAAVSTGHLWDFLSCFNSKHLNHCSVLVITKQHWIFISVLRGQGINQSSIHLCMSANVLEPLPSIMQTETPLKMINLHILLWIVYH